VPDWKKDLKALGVNLSILETPAERFAAACTRVWKKGKVASCAEIFREMKASSGNRNRWAKAALAAGLVRQVKQSASRGFFVPVQKGEK
jgi:hypothetical protein